MSPYTAKNRHPVRSLRQTNEVVRVLFAGATALATLATPAVAMGICASYDVGQRELTLKLRTGCVSSSIRPLPDTLVATQPDGTASIRINGGFRYKPLPEGQRIVTADCMGNRHKEITLRNVAPRRYIVVAGEERRGVLDFSDTKSGKPMLCLPSVGLAHAGVRFPRVEPALKGRLDALKARAPGSIAMIVQPLMEELSPEPEGAGSVEMQATTRNAGGRQFSVITISGHGLLDDSVSGIRYEVTLQQDGDRWSPIGLRQWRMCARGESAGQWTSTRCS